MGKIIGEGILANQYSYFIHSPFISYFIYLFTFHITSPRPFSSLPFSFYPPIQYISCYPFYIQALLASALL